MLLDARVQAIVDELTQRIKGDGERLRAGADRYSDDMVQAAGPDAAGFLNLLIRAKDARLIVEVGTSVGYTALYMGDAARATGGRVIGTEMIEKKHAQAVEYLRRAGLDGENLAALGLKDSLDLHRLALLTGAHSAPRGERGQ